MFVSELPANAKPYKGLGMEGAVAKWYASLNGSRSIAPIRKAAANTISGLSYFELVARDFEKSHGNNFGSS